ncbi:MAG TPA: head GIN domain-containing protein [Ginsengibacter sp.]|nr:head GIN domain-containing protein [Ginsengibacter sp.]
MKFFLVVGTFVVFSSCNIINGHMLTGNGNIRTEKRNTGNFRAVKTSGSIDVEINSGNAYEVSVEDDDNLLPYVVTEVNNGTLNIHYENNTSINNDHAKVYVTVPSLDKLVASGSADITIRDVLKNTQKFELNVSGSGNIKGAVDAPAVSIGVSGSGNVDLKGRTKDFECSVSGSGDVDCGGLQSENATVKVTGSGNAHVFASVNLSASISGSGDVYYGGSPKTEIHSSGSGSVQPEK